MKETSYMTNPVEVKAIQYTGNNFDEIQEELVKGEEPNPIILNPSYSYLMIRTPQKWVSAFPKDWIVKDYNGELYVIKPGICYNTFPS